MVTIEGIVAVEATPIAGVEVQVDGTAKSVTDEEGLFSVLIPASPSTVVLGPAQSGLSFTPVSGLPQDLALTNQSFNGTRLIVPGPACYFLTPDDIFVRFGYNNTTNAPIQVSLGILNELSPESADSLGPPETFESGEVQEGFIASIPIDEEEPLTWYFLGTTVTASEQCGADIECPDGSERDYCFICGGDGYSCRGCVELDPGETIDQVSQLFTEASQLFLDYALEARLEGVLPRSVNLLRVLKQHSTVLQRTKATLESLREPVRFCRDIVGCRKISTKKVTGTVERSFGSLSSSLSRLKNVKSRATKYQNRLKRRLGDIPRTYHVCE